MVELQEIETRNWRLAYVGLELRSLKAPLTIAARPSCYEWWKCILGLTNDTKICVGIEMRIRCDVRPTNHRRYIMSPAYFDDLMRIYLLSKHATRHDHICPRQVAI